MKPGKDYPGVAVAFFCHDGKGNYLLQKRGKKTRGAAGTWDVGGGGVETGELIEDGLFRELKEEYCTTPLSYEFLGYRDYINPSYGGHWICFDFKVRVDPIAVSIGEPDKIDEIRWLPISDVPEPIFPQLKEAIAKWNGRL